MPCSAHFKAALLDNARFLPPRPPTADEKILRLAQALYVAETAADEQQTAAGGAAGGDAAEPHAAAVPDAAATLAKAADFVLKARTELEVRSTRRVFRVVKTSSLTTPASFSRCWTSSATSKTARQSTSWKCSVVRACFWAPLRVTQKTCSAALTLLLCLSTSVTAETQLRDLSIRHQAKLAEVRRRA